MSRIPQPLTEIPDFPGYYAATDGTLWSFRRHEPIQLKGDPRKEDGRLRYTLRRKDGKYIRKYGSFFVLLAFVGPKPNPQMECCHKDGNCLNDAPTNLYWGTCVQNKADMLRHGTRLFGDRHPRTKIRARSIPRIRRLRKAGLTLGYIARQYGVTETRIYQICKGAS